jgi:hypothetical protein
LTAESWEILCTLNIPRTREGHLAALKSTFDFEAEGDVDAVLGTRLDELLRLGLIFPV